jgi:uncharacterized protein YehS (DUF1456 family)
VKEPPLSVEDSSNSGIFKQCREGLVWRKKWKEDFKGIPWYTKDKSNNIVFLDKDMANACKE